MEGNFYETAFCYKTGLVIVMKKIIFADIKHRIFETEKFMQALYINSKGLLNDIPVTDMTDEKLVEATDEIYKELVKNNVSEDDFQQRVAPKNTRKKHHKHVVFTKSLIKEFYPYTNFTIVFKFS
jgi:hypothetical protein